jgi:hypothetical protein
MTTHSPRSSARRSPTRSSIGRILVSPGDCGSRFLAGRVNSVTQIEITQSAKSFIGHSILSWGKLYQSVFFTASHAARCVARHGVRSHAVPVALVGRVLHPGGEANRSAAPARRS